MTFGQELVVLLATPFMYNTFQCMLGGSVDVWAKNILYRFIEGQTHLGLPRSAKWFWPQWVEIGSSSFKFKHYLQYAPKVEIDCGNCIQNNQWSIIGDQLPTKIPLSWRIELIRDKTFVQQTSSYRRAFTTHVYSDGWFLYHTNIIVLSTISHLQFSLQKSTILLPVRL